MPKSLRCAPILFWFLFPLLALAADQPSSIDLRGSVSEGHIYRNTTLGMTIMLPGEWLLLPLRPFSNSVANCQGPLCHSAMRATLEMKSENPKYKVDILAFKLSPLDQAHYPLSKLAEVMMVGSMGGSNLIPIGIQTFLRLDGKPAYRLLAGPDGKVAKVIGYVAEANGYIFLLVGSAHQSSIDDLQSAIENMKLH
jgi:hypothetical protein